MPTRFSRLPARRESTGRRLQPAPPSGNSNPTLEETDGDGSRCSRHMGPLGPAACPTGGSVHSNRGGASRGNGPRRAESRDCGAPVGTETPLQWACISDAASGRPTFVEPGRAAASTGSGSRFARGSPAFRRASVEGLEEHPTAPSRGAQLRPQPHGRSSPRSRWVSDGRPAFRRRYSLRTDSERDLGDSRGSDGLLRSQPRESTVTERGRSALAGSPDAVFARSPPLSAVSGGGHPLAAVLGATVSDEGYESAIAVGTPNLHPPRIGCEARRQKPMVVSKTAKTPLPSDQSVLY